MRVDHKAGVIKLTIPPRTPQFSINRFLNRNRDWIEERQKSLMPKAEITNGETIPFSGKDLEIIINRHEKRTTDINITDNTLVITTSRDDPTSNLKRWIIEQARLRIEPLCRVKALQIGKEFKKIDLRDTGSRWGSCSSDKRLMFSWRLIMAPDYVLDYVVAHEVAHLVHMDHSKQFWDTCYSLSLRADEARMWLKINGNGLMRYF